jgi:hypothetical protein
MSGVLLNFIRGGTFEAHHEHRLDAVRVAPLLPKIVNADMQQVCKQKTSKFAC